MKQKIKLSTKKNWNNYNDRKLKNVVFERVILVLKDDCPHAYAYKT